MRSGIRSGGQTTSWVTSVSTLLCVLIFSHTFVIPITANYTRGLRYPLFPGEYGVQAVSNLSDFRSTILAHAVSEFPENSDQSEKLARFDAYPITVACPPGQKIKVVGKGEGIKYACDLSALVAPCLVYSFGSQNDFAFEADILQNTPCEVHTFDCTSQPRDLGSRHRYHNWCLGKGQTDSVPSWWVFKNYTEIVKELGHKGHKVDVLKVDIEGYEFQALSGLRESTLNLPHQILVELHFSVGPAFLPDAEDVSAKSVPQMSLLFAHLANLGYGISYRADNPILDIGCCSEFSLLRVEGIHVHDKHTGLRSGNGKSLGL